MIKVLVRISFLSILFLLISLISSAEVKAIRLPAILTVPQREELANELSVSPLASPTSASAFIDVEVNDMSALRLWKFYYTYADEHILMDGILTATNTLPDLRDSSLKMLVHSPVVKVVGNVADEIRDILKHITIPIMVADKGCDFILKGAHKGKGIYISLYKTGALTPIATLISASSTKIASFVYEHILCKRRVTKKTVLYVDSIPKGIDVVIDNEFRVRTPVLLNDIPTGIHEFKVFNELQYVYIDGKQKVLTLKRLPYPKVLFYSDIKGKDIPVEIDGNDYGKIPLIVKGLRKGKHRIRIEDEEFKASNEYVFVKDKYFQMIKIEMKRREKRIEKRFGTVDITTDWKAECYIDNVKIGTTPIKGLSLSYGKHKVRLIRKGYEEIKRVFTVNATSLNLKFKMRGLSGTLVGRYFVGNEPVKDAFMSEDMLFLYYKDIIKAYEIENESPLWKMDIMHPITSAQVVGESLILTTFDGNVYSLNTRDGKVLSRLKVMPTLLRKPIVFSNKSNPYTMMWLSSDYGYLYLIGIEGGILKVLWELDVRNPLIFMGLKGKILYVMDAYGRAFAMDVKTRLTKWKTDLNALVKDCVLKDDGIYVSTDKGFFEVDLDGSEIKKMSRRIPSTQKRHEEGIDLGEGLIGIQKDDGYFILTYK